MRRFALLLICVLAFASLAALADTYSLTDGTKIDGDPISITENGVVFRGADGNDMPRVIWDNLTQESIQKLLTKVKSPRERTLIEPLIEEPPKARAERQEITVHPIEKPFRPAKDLGLTAMFGSPVGMMILFVLYCAVIFAGYEVAVYRRRPMALVCGLAAIPFLGVLSPIIFGSMPTLRGVIETQMDNAQTRFQETAPPSDAVTAPPPEDVAPVQEEAVAAAPAAPTLPEPIVFKRGDFSFNRRFFETKLAGFARPVLGDAEKDMVIYIKSGRGEFLGQRISRITPSEIYLQTFHGHATADEMIPFIEVMEVQIRHRDLA